MPALYNPVHLAQEAALIDVLSRGRLILGVGAGYHKDYFAHFGVPIKQREGRFEETMEIVEKAWTTVGPFAHHGKYFNFDAIHVTPKPYQRPRPPIWIGAFGPKSIARAGRMSDAWSAAPFFDRIENIKAQVSIYREAAAKAGRKPSIALFRDGWLASSREEAEQTFGKLWLEECKFYFRNGMLEPTEDFGSESDFTLESIRGRGHAIIGTKDDWLEALDRWNTIMGGIDWYVLRIRVPLGPSPQKVLECIQRLGEEVLPQARKT
jgi:alkanesulfonate monooxygenase SsuD/methylene tetrahydromethanopterin reductase-like flavin-dependent oxidoreductase (luciferase family)